jgi:hypothetical protein
MIATSRVFSNVRNAYALMQSAPWTPNPTTGRDVQVSFVAPIGGPMLETVTVFSGPTDPVEREARTLGYVTYDENVVVKVLIECQVPDPDPLVVWARLEELADIAQNVFRDPATGRPVDLGDDLTPAQVAGGPLRLTPTLFPDPSGFTGQVELDVLARSRI